MPIVKEMPIKEVIANTIHDTVADITGYEDEASSAIVCALRTHGYVIVPISHLAPSAD